MHTNIKKAAIILLALTCIYQTAQQWHNTIYLDGGAEALTAWEARFEVVKEILPIERGIVGYLGEWDIPGIEYEESDQRAEYILTQYALAPLILVRGTNVEWNVAVLKTHAFQAWEVENGENYKVYPLHNNVYILQKKGNK